MQSFYPGVSGTAWIPHEINEIIMLGNVEFTQFKQDRNAFFDLHAEITRSKINCMEIPSRSLLGLDYTAGGVFLACSSFRSAI